MGNKTYIRNCLQDVDIRDERRCGNSTRQIDRAIQILHEDGIVHILDHFKNGEDKKANLYLFGRVVDRLYNDKILHSQKTADICKDELTIKLTYGRFHSL